MTKKNDTTGSVGFGRPPIEHQFKTGRSGNPKGRPKGSVNFSTEVNRMLNMPVPIERDGKRQKVSTLLASLLRLRDNGINKGQIRAIDRILELAMLGSAEPQDDGEMSVLAAKDQEILDAYYAERSREEATSDPDARTLKSATDQGNGP